MVEETNCCPIFDPKKWDEKTINWKDKKFIKDRVKSIFHIPLNFGKVITKNTRLMERAGDYDKKYISITDENSLWGADLYIETSKEIPEANNVTLSGTFLTKVFEGPFKNIKNWMEEMKVYVSSKKKELNHMYFYYTTCPKCAKVYGTNYVVILARV